MKIKIQENSISMDDLNRKLTEHFSGKYKVIKRNKHMIAIAKSKTIGAVVIPSKNWIAVSGGIPTMERQIVFTVIIILLGIIIPLIIYCIFFHTKMKSVEKEVGEFLKKEYKNELLFTP